MAHAQQSHPEIHILLAGEQIGPFSERKIRQYLSEGLITRFDMATANGLAGWEALDIVLASLPQPASATPAHPELPLEPSISSMPVTAPNSAPPSPASSPSPDNALQRLMLLSQKTKRKLNKIVIQPIL